jgi:hypothetical protein
MEEYPECVQYWRVKQVTVMEIKLCICVCISMILCMIMHMCVCVCSGTESRLCQVLESKISDRDEDQTVYMCVYIHDFVYDYAYVCV